MTQGASSLGGTQRTLDKCVVEDGILGSSMFFYVTAVTDGILVLLASSSSEERGEGRIGVVTSGGHTLLHGL